MANIKIIDLSTGSPESNSYIEATQVDSQAASGRSSVKVNMAEFGNWIAGQGNSPLEYNDLKTEDDTPIGAINELHDSIGADVFDPNTSYTAGMYCIYNNTLYRCKSPTSGAWDSTKWEAKTITSLLESKANSSDTYTKTQVDNALSDKEDSLSKGTGNLNANNLFAVNGYYRCVSGNISNCPNNDGNLIVIYNGDGNSTMQLFFVSTGEYMYFRNTWGAGTISWTTWKKIQFTT